MTCGALSCKDATRALEVASIHNHSVSLTYRHGGPHGAKGAWWLAPGAGRRSGSPRPAEHP